MTHTATRGRGAKTLVRLSCLGVAAGLFIAASVPREALALTSPVNSSVTVTTSTSLVGGLSVGAGGTGSLTISSGATLSANGALELGVLSGDNGAVTVTGSPSKLSVYQGYPDYIGDGGTGTLTVENGGTFSGGLTYLGYGSGASGTVLVTGSGSTWTTNGDITVGTSGTGTLTVANGATATITAGTNTKTVYLGKNSGSTGTLNIGNGASAGILDASTVNGGAGTAILNFDHTDSAYYFTSNGTSSGTPIAITGSTAVNQIGSGTTILTGTNTYTGGTTVSAGILRSGAAGAFVGNTAYTVNGGTLDLNSNDLTMSALSGSGGGITLGSAALTVNQSGNTTFAGTVSGSGSLTKSGAGVLILDGTNTYSGTTTVSGGTLEVGDASHSGATIASDVTIASSGTLRGHGTVTGSVANNGTIRPGGSIGTLTVNGSVTFNNGSSLNVDVSPSAASLLHVSGSPGTATINSGATVNVLASSGTYAPSTQYTILTADGGVSGTFGAATSNLAFLTPMLSYGANNVYLTLVSNNTNFASVATTANQRAVASALDTIAVAGPTGDMQTQINAIYGLSASQAQAAYTSLDGASLNYFNDAQLGFMDGFAGLLSGRLDGAPSGMLAFNRAPARLAPAAMPVSDVTPVNAVRHATKRGAWVQAYGNDGHTDGDGNAPAYDLRGAGLVAGLDCGLQNGWRIGAALAYGHQRFSTDLAAGTVDGTAAAVYGRYGAGPWLVKLLASLGVTSNQGDRSVVYATTNRSAHASFHGVVQSLYAESDYTMALHGTTVQPVAALAYTRLRNPAYTESGAGSVNLNVAGQTRTSLRSYLGARLLVRVGDLRVEPRLIWTHQFGDVHSASLAAAFAGSPATAFEVQGTQVSRNGAQLGLRLVKSRARGFTLYADLSAQLDNRSTNVALVAGLRRRW